MAANDSATIGHCRDCRWWRAGWQDGPTTYDFPVGAGTCIQAQMDDKQPRFSGSAFMAIDCEGGYGARLLTRPDFGCVQFAAKEAAS